MSVLVVVRRASPPVGRSQRPSPPAPGCARACPCVAARRSRMRSASRALASCRHRAGRAVRLLRNACTCRPRTGSGWSHPSSLRSSNVEGGRPTSPRQCRTLLYPRLFSGIRSSIHSNVHLEAIVARGRAASSTASLACAGWFDPPLTPRFTVSVPIGVDDRLDAKGQEREAHVEARRPAPRRSCSRSLRGSRTPCSVADRSRTPGTPFRHQDDVGVVPGHPAARGRAR